MNSSTREEIADIVSGLILWLVVMLFEGLLIFLGWPVLMKITGVPVVDYWEAVSLCVTINAVKNVWEGVKHS